MPRGVYERDDRHRTAISSGIRRWWGQRTPQQRAKTPEQRSKIGDGVRKTRLENFGPSLKPAR